MALSGWVESVFCKRECVQFMPGLKDNAKCCCGNLWQYHRDGSPATIRNDESHEFHWNPTRHTHLLPTDAYGTIEFHGGPHPTKAQYIRLAHDTPPSLILELFTREWGLDLPKLLISIHGGKTNFDLQPKLKKVIRKDLLKAAKTTGAWVFTGGLNTGATRHAGEALASDSGLKDRSARIVSVGIAPWGIVERRLELVGKNKDVAYHPVNSPNSRFCALNNHHSYFLLVDNGTAGKYGPEIILRRKLENYISQQRIEARGGMATPTVCVVIEGGPHTIRQVLEYVTDSPPLPVIICDGTGRAADILAFVHKYESSGLNVLENNQASIVASLERVFDLNCDQAEKLFYELLQCVKKKDLITVFRLKEGSELDQSILSALLNAKSLTPPEQLSLALTWNRVDIARSHVFNESVEWPQDSLDQAMMDALINDRIEFVKLLLEKGVSMKKFLSVSRLEDLYNAKQGPQNTLQYIMKEVKKMTGKDSRYSLIEVGLAINKLMGGAFRSSYTRKKFRSALVCIRPSSPLSNVTNGSLFGAGRFSPKKVSPHESPQPIFEYPFSDLLVWAVLTKRQQLALLMWQHGEEAVAKALVAAKLYKALAHEGADDDLETEVHEELRNYAKEFENLALEVLDYCYQQDEVKTNQLLTYELKNWSKQTCLSLAVAVNHRAFLSHTCCQILLADLWLGGLQTRKNTNIKVIFGLLCPPVIAVLGFRSREELRSMPQTYEEHLEEEPDKYSDSGTDSDAESEDLDTRNYQDQEGQTVAVAVISSSDNLEVPLFHWTSPNMTTYPAPVMSPIIPRGEKGANVGSPLSGTAMHSDAPSKELHNRIKYYEFYNAPITKFWAHTIAFVFFLGVFTYIALVKLPLEPEWPEWFVLAYLSTYFLEIFREILSKEPDKLSNKLEVWSEKLWNVCDMAFTSLFILGFCLRLRSGAVHDAGRVMYCVDVSYWYLRVLEILSANKYLGPLVMMMGKMVKNMMYFVILLLVVLISFGICRQSILFPNEEPNWRLIRHVFYQPYFMLYGEVFAGDIDPDCGGVDEIECQPGRWITPSAMSIYLLVANILLINLMIAVFNSIFHSVNAISLQVWMFQRFQVVMEFEEKPVFPPPLIILSHFNRAFKYVRRHWKGKLSTYSHGLKRFLEGENLERLHDFEEECMDSYMKEKEQQEQMKTEERVRVMTERTDLLAQKLEDTHNKMMKALTSLNNLEFHVKHLHEEIQQTNTSYATIHRFMLRYLGKKSSDTSSGTVSPLGSLLASPHQSLRAALQDGSVWAPESRRMSLPEKTESSEIEEEEETIRGRHGNYVLKVNLNEKRRRLGRERRSLRRMLSKKEASEAVKSSDEPTRRKMSRKTKRTVKDLKKMSTSSRVSFEAHHSSNDDVFGVANNVPRHLEHHLSVSGRPPLERHCSVSGRPLEPPIITLTAEYTSLADELETVFLTSVTPPASPSERYFHSRHLSETADAEASNPLRDAEEADYNLMEGIIKRRMHRDSENLAVSLEDLCSMFPEIAEEGNIEGCQTQSALNASPHHIDKDKLYSSASNLECILYERCSSLFPVTYRSLSPSRCHRTPCRETVSSQPSFSGLNLVQSRCQSLPIPGLDPNPKGSALLAPPPQCIGSPSNSLILRPDHLETDSRQRTSEEPKVPTWVPLGVIEEPKVRTRVPLGVIEEPEVRTRVPLGVIKTEGRQTSSKDECDETEC